MRHKKNAGGGQPAAGERDLSLDDSGPNFTTNGTHDQDPNNLADAATQLAPTTTLLEQLHLTWDMFHHPSGVIEVRALVDGKGNSKAWEGWGKTVSGYFDDRQAFTKALVALDKEKTVKGVYVTMNPVLPALMSRASNRLKAAAEKATTTADTDIVLRHRLLIDADPYRPANISSTVAELAEARAKRDELVAYLSTQGFPPWALADSGNGAHAIGAVDLPNTPESTQLLSDFLAALNWKFGTTPGDRDEARRQFAAGITTVGIDTTVFNAARITKLYGSWARKGDHTTDRPHRRAKFTFIPERIDPIPAELLATVIKEHTTFLAEQAPPKQAKQPPPPKSSGKPGANWADSVEGVEGWFAEHSVTLGQRAGYTSDGYQYKWDVPCITSTEHTDGAVILWGADKGLGYKCHHDSCKGKGWADVRAIIDPKPEPTIGPRYRVIDNRICMRTQLGKNGSEREVYTPLCNFTAQIIADVAQDDGEQVDRHLAIVGTLYDGQPLPEVMVKATDFESMSWAIANWGGRITIEPGRGMKDNLRHAIQTLSIAGMANRRSYTHTGWREIEGQRVFLANGGAIGMAGVNVDLPDNLRHYRFPTDEAVLPVTAMRASLDLLNLADPQIVYPLLAATYLPVLSEMLTPAFVVWIEGFSGSLKSSTMAVLLNHFGAGFHEYELPADWLGTANSLEKLAFHAKDVPLLIDDFRPALNRAENKNMQDAAGRIIRAAGNRQGRSRLDSGSNFKRSYAPRGMVVSTAERGALGLSVNSRLLTVTIGQGDVSSKLLAAAQKQRHIYSYAMRGFIRYVAEHWDDLKAQLRNDVSEARLAYSTGNQHLRLPNAAATLYTAFDVVLAYAKSLGAIDDNEAAAHQVACFTALQEVAEAQSAIVEAQDPALAFVTVLLTLLVQRKARIIGKEGMQDMGGELGEIQGWWKSGEICLYPSAYNAVAHYITQEGGFLTADATALGQELARGGYLAAQDDDRVKILRRDPDGKRTRVYVLSPQKLWAVAGTLGIAVADLFVMGRQKDVS